jgi:hypothetical protein
MERTKFIMQGIGINEVQATLISELIKDIPNDRLKEFLIFRLNYVEEFKSNELITKTALFEFRKIQHLQAIQNNQFRFDSVDEVITFCKTYFKNKDLCYGAASFFDYVVIYMDKDSNLLNKFKLTEQGNYSKLDSHDELKVYHWLFVNQNRIGVVKNIPYFEDKSKYQLEFQNMPINTKEIKQLNNEIGRLKGLIGNSMRIDYKMGGIKSWSS